MGRSILKTAALIIILLLSQITYGFTDSKPHPILDWSKRIIGGTYKGKWLNRNEIVKYIIGGEKYKLYTQDKFLGEFEGSEPAEECYLSGDKGYRIEIKGAKDQEYIDSIVGVSGDWNVLPRIPKVDNRKIMQKDKFITGILKKNGISASSIHFNSRVSVDLDNDHIQETFLVASNITDKVMGDFLDDKEIDQANLYSLIVLRKTVNDKEQNVVISANYKELMLNELSFIADVDGDRKMEFLINIENIEACPAEGFSTRYQDLYDIEDNTVKKIFSNFSNPI